MTRDVALGLGANLGSRLTAMRCVRDLIEARGDVRVVSTSRVYETEPVGPPQPRFLNAAVRVRTGLTLRQLLDRSLEIERLLGRERRERWGPRSVDVDVLYAGDERIDEEGLGVPHPRLRERAFALAPLLDVWPEAPLDLRHALEARGGPPASWDGLDPLPWRVTERGGEVRVEADARDRPDALASALTGLARTLAPSHGAAPALPAARVGWCGPGDDPERCLRALLDGLASGFRATWVTLGPGPRGPEIRLIGTAGDPPRHTAEPSRAQLAESNGRLHARVHATLGDVRVESAK